MSTKTHWKKLTNPDYIGAYSLMVDETPIELTVKITKVVREMVKGEGGKKEECTVAYLEGQKPFILNATNCKTITAMYGTPFIEDWAGKSITLFVSQTKVAGDTVDCLRIRPAKPNTKLPELTPLHPKWNSAMTAIYEGTYKIEDVKKKYSISPENEKLLTAKEESNV